MAQKGEQPAPEAWIGHEVVIGVGTASARVTGELLEVNDRGIVIHVRSESTRTPARVFYPWTNVQAIQLPDEEQPEEEPPE